VLVIGVSQLGLDLGQVALHCCLVVQERSNTFHLAPDGSSGRSYRSSNHFGDAPGTGALERFDFHLDAVVDIRVRHFRRSPSEAVRLRR
jgi:hypothetical protein